LDGIGQPSCLVQSEPGVVDLSH